MTNKQDDPHKKVINCNRRGSKITSPDFLAVAEMVPDLIWAPDLFGLREIWSEKFGSNFF